MYKYDASVILNLHREGDLLLKTLCSLNEAADFAARKGYGIELVAILDRADEVTAGILHSFHDHNFLSVNIVEVSNGSLGLSRNDGVANSQGEYIFMADGDDLISTNYFYSFLEYAKDFDKDTVFYPEAVFGFEDAYYISLYQRLGDVSPQAFLEAHPYISRTFAHREIFEKTPYSDVKLSNGYAYEDWHFNCNVLAAGASIEVVPDTILFYRQRKGSLLKEANKLSTRLIPPSALFNPDTYMDVCLRHNVNASSNKYQEYLTSKYQIHNNNILKEAIIKASLIEPLIRLDKYLNSIPFSNASLPTYLGNVYYKIAPILGEMDYDDIFILPFILNGGAEKYINEVAWSLYRQKPESNVLMILCEGDVLVSKRDKLPPNVTCLDFHSFSRFLTLDQRCILIVKILQSSNGTCRVHIRQSTIGMEFLEKYSKLFSHLQLIFYRFTDAQYVDNGNVVTGYSPLPILEKSIEHISMLICDNETVIKKDALSINDVSKWHFLPAPVNINCPNSVAHHPLTNKKVVWASRLDHQKRVQMLPAISSGLSDKGFELDVYGEVVLGGVDLDYLTEQSINYKGKFNGLSSLSLNNYTYFLYTSYYDGIPNVLLEALAAGMIVIAPNIGGVPEVIKHLETGYLIETVTDDDLLVQRYIDAILYLDSNPEILTKIREGAFTLLEKQHSFAAYDQRVAELFLSNETRTEPNQSSDALLLQHYKRHLKNLNYEFECSQSQASNVVVNNERWNASSRAHKLAELYVQTAQGPNAVIKMIRFGKSLGIIVARKIRQRYFN